MVSSSQGAVFTLYFPLCEQGTESRWGAEPVSLQGRQEKILVVDDDPQLRDIAEQLLRSLNYQVVSLGSGEEAIHYLKQNETDLLLLDMMMAPGISGRETYEILVEEHPALKTVIVSGFSATEDVKATLKLGARTFLKKPYSLEKLGHVMHKVLSD